MRSEILTTSIAASYRGYDIWKGWTEFFTFSNDEADYFAGEMRGVRIASAEVLEIGFGRGSFLSWASENGAHLAGTEINPTLLSAAKAFGIDLLPPEIEAIAHENMERFDTIVALDVLEHFTIPELVNRLEAIETMLKSGGRFVARFPNAQSPFGLVPQNGDPTHRSWLCQSVFEQLLQTRVLHIERYGPAFRAPGRGLARRVVRLVRAGVRKLIAMVLNFAYATDVPLAPVVVLVLRKE